MAIDKMKFWCQKVLPLTYDESLSYYEVLCKTNQKLNEVIDAINNISTMVVDYNNLENLPAINDITLIGNKSDEDLNLADRAWVIELVRQAITVAINSHY